MRLNIGIDGPVGAGKSSVADAVAARLGILHLDTGAMYRALGMTALRRGIDTYDEKAIVKLCRELDIPEDSYICLRDCLSAELPDTALGGFGGNR